MILCAITPPVTLGGKAGVFDIITVDFRFRINRIANIRHLIIFSLYFLYWLALGRFVTEFASFDR